MSDATNDDYDAGPPVVFGRVVGSVEDVPRCQPDPSLAAVMTDQFAYLAAVTENGEPTPSERSRWVRIMAILLEPFEASGPYLLKKAA